MYRAVAPLLITVALVVSCGRETAGGPETPPSQTAQTASGLARLTERELQAEFKGASIRFDSVASDGEGEWRFGCDGSWTALGGAVGEIQGRYNIDSDALCLNVGERLACLAVYRSADGALFISANGDGEHRPDEPVRAIRLTRSESGCS